MVTVVVSFHVTMVLMFSKRVSSVVTAVLSQEGSYMSIACEVLGQDTLKISETAIVK